MLYKVEPSSTFYNNLFFQLATLKFVARQVEHAVVIWATTCSTCNATMLRDKLNKNAARITGPLGVLFKISDEHLRPFHMGVPLGGGGGGWIKNRPCDVDARTTMKVTFGFRSNKVNKREMAHYLFHFFSQ